VVYLGAAVPPTDLRAVVIRLQPRLVALSASSDEAAHAVAEAAALLAALPEPRPLVGYGGRAYERPDSAAVPPPGGTYLGPDARAAAQQIAVLLGGPPA
jgi:hypothetical protein